MLSVVSARTRRCSFGYVGAEVAVKRFVERADLRGWLETRSDDDSEYFSVYEEEGVLS